LLEECAAALLWAFVGDSGRHLGILHKAKIFFSRTR
jgi:hypothetical protein